MRSLITLLAFLAINAHAQNLVPNQSFENINHCPLNTNDYSAMANWYRVGITSVDMFNTCSPSPDAGVPQNFLGMQNAQQGNAYVGVVLFLNDPQQEYREYVAVKLTHPLEPTLEYCVRFYVAQADSAGLQTNTIAAYLGDSIYPAQGPNQIKALPYTPQIQTTQFIENNAGWQLVEDSYVAQGGEQYITIGSFTKDVDIVWGPNSAVPSTSPQATQYYRQSYVYIDNVTVEECKKVGLDEEGANGIKLYPNPANGFIILETPAVYDEVQVQLYSITGALVKQCTLKGGAKNKVDVSGLSGGIYIAQVQHQGQVISHKKVLVTN